MVCTEQRLWNGEMNTMFSHFAEMGGEIVKKRLS